MSLLYHQSIPNNFFNEQHIRFLTTRTHAGVAERQIRTIKDMLHKRMENSESQDWEDHIGYALLAYNHKMVNRSTGMTPYEARKERNHIDVKQNLELRAKHTLGSILILTLVIGLKYIPRRRGLIRSVKACGLPIPMMLKVLSPHMDNRFTKHLQV